MENQATTESDTKTETKQTLQTKCTQAKFLRARSHIPVVGVTGRDPGWSGALKLPVPPYSRRVNTIRQKGSAWRVLPTFEY